MGRVDRMRFVLFSGFVLALCILAMPSWSGASEIVYYSNISVNNYPNEYGTGYLSLTTDLWQAMPFTATSSDDVNYIAVAVAGPNPITIDLDSSIDTSANPRGQPGSVLGSWTIATPPSFSAPCCYGAVVPFNTAGPVLTANTQYWLVASESSSTSPLSDAWYFSYNSAAGYTRYSLDAGATWGAPPASYLGAFEVAGTPVATAPEPSSICLLALALGMLLWALRSRLNGLSAG